MTYLTFEWDLLVIQLLNMAPIVHFEFDGFGKAFAKAHFNTNMHTCLHIIFWLVVINEFSNYVSNCMNRFISLVVKGEVREPDLNWNSTGDI